MVPTPAAPERSLPQRMEALQHANDIRTKRAIFKRDLKLGKISIIDALLDPQEWLLSAKVFDLLIATPKYGRVKTNKALQLVRISPSKTLGGLSPRQRTELASMLRGVWSAPSRPESRPLIIAPPTEPASAVPPTTFERRVLALAAGAFGEVNRSNVYRAATALGSNPGAVIRACGDLQRKGLVDLTGRPTIAGREHSSVIPAATAA